MDKLSRRKLAQYVASRASGSVVPGEVMRELAAYLIDTRRVRQAELVVRAIEDELAANGMVVADVTSAHPLTDAEKAQIKELVGANSIALRETVDPTVIGGVRVKTPESTLDATIINKLHALKRAKQ